MEKTSIEYEKTINIKQKKGKSVNTKKTSRVKELRDKLEMTQVEFAEELNRDFQMISQIERGKIGLYLPFAIDISKRFNVSLDWLYELSDDTKDPASEIINNLKEIFNIDFAEKTITVDDNLFKLIEELSSAYKIKNQQSMPDEPFKLWIEAIKKRYNEATGSFYISKYHITSLDEALGIEIPSHITGKEFANKQDQDYNIDQDA